MSRSEHWGSSEGGAWAAPALGFLDFLEPQRLCSLAQRGLKGQSEGGMPFWPALYQPTAHASHGHCREYERL